jgi:hypothetical protein
LEHASWIGILRREVQVIFPWKHIGSGPLVLSAPLKVAAFGTLSCIFLAMFVLTTVHVSAQELEPQRWRHLPVNTNFATVTYLRNEADISFDPTLGISNAQSTVDTFALAYLRTFNLFDRTAEVRVLQPWQNGTWSGNVLGEPATVSRSGLADTEVRFAVQLFGAPPLEGKEYATYRASPGVRTNGGIALSAQLPTGEYKKDKLINLGSNRYTFRPEVGIVHDRGDWVFEASGVISFYTDNTSYFNGNRLEQKPFYFAQANVLHRFRPDLWGAIGAGYAIGAESSVNGVGNDDQRENALWGLAAGYSFTPFLGVQLKYIRSENLTDVGSSSDRYIASFSAFW